MTDCSAWVERFVSAVKDAFGERVRFVGLQGSRGRGEASENSDVDMVVILDSVSADDIKRYDAVLDAVGERELACGFLSGENELLRWEPSELFQFCHDTTPLIGSLDAALAKVGPEDVSRAVRIGACGVYHGCVHNMIYEKSTDILKALYKSATFVIRARLYKQRGIFVRRLSDLAKEAEGADKTVAETFASMTCGQTFDFDARSEILFLWAKDIISADF